MINIKDWKLWLAALIAFLIVVGGFFVFTEGAKYQYLNTDGIEVPDNTVFEPIEETLTDAETLSNAPPAEETIVVNDTYEADSNFQVIDSATVDYYDIPLSETDQGIVFEICEQYDILPEVIFAMMFVESRFNHDSVGSSGELGYMQILPSPTGEYVLSCLGINYSWNPDDDDYIAVVLSDVRTNVECSVYLIKLFYDRYGSLNQALMCYNSGEGGAQSLWSEGIYDTYYSSEVFSVMAQLVKK